MDERYHVGALADFLPGTLRYADLDGLPVALANLAGEIVAFSDACRHQGGPLSAGVLIGETVTCPWHGWTYNVRNGKAVVPPVGLRIATYPVSIENGQIYVTVRWA